MRKLPRVLQEEVGEVAHEVNEGIGPDRNIDKRRLLKELIEVAAVAVACAERTLKEIPEHANTYYFDTPRHIPRERVAVIKTADIEVDPASLSAYMVHANRASGSVFVKEKAYFILQGGDKEEWGTHWKEVQAKSIEHARELGCDMFPWAKHYSAQAKP